MSIIPTLHFNTDALDPAQAFAAWRDLMAPIIRVEQVPDGPTPRGNLSCTMLGDVLASRMVFSPQRMIRDRRHAAATPDHFTFMLYVSGGLSGEIAGCTVVQQRNRIMAANMGRELDAHGVRSSAIGLTIPRRLLADLVIERIPTFLDRERNRLLMARLHALYRRLPTTGADEEQALARELTAFVRRLFDPSSASDVLHGPELDVGLIALAERVMDLHLGAPDLSPQWLADGTGVSRTVLYRAFRDTGGVMHRVWERRLEATRLALQDPLETRPLTRLASEHGFRTPAHLSHAFRARFGVPPREWRRIHASPAARRFEPSPAQAHAWYERLGQR
ncbi:helix-turn-helix domain-containing protein [Methylobacterium phyllosphaerae]